MQPSRVAVIGAGLFGSVIAHTLAVQGHDVVLYDARKPGSGSVPAACLMKPSWFSGAMGKRESEAALELLDQMYGVQDLSFTLRPTRSNVTVHWVQPRKILTLGHELGVRVTRGSITRVQGDVDRIVANGGGSWMVSAMLEDKRCTPQHVSSVVVAAGVWCNDILVRSERAHEPEAIHVPGLEGRAGSAFVFPKAFVPGTPSFIAPWAPYRQIVGFDRGDGYWIGDGSAIKPANWTDEHSRKSYARCLSQLGVDDTKAVVYKELHGMRPYVPNVKPCYLREHWPRLFVCTGGAKNGTIAAAWAALRVAEALG